MTHPVLDLEFERGLLSFMRLLFLRTIFLALLLVSIITARAQTGREYGNTPVPLFVSHIPKANRFMLRRKEAPSHNILNKIICFEPKCRRVIGWQSRQKGMSLAELKKKIRKNAKQGAYKSYEIKPAIKPTPDQRPDSLVAVKATSTANESIQVSAPVQRDSLIILNENQLLFEVNRHELKGDHQAALDSVAALLNRYPGLTAEISGHTDNTGSDAHNARLSTLRAEAVADYLVERGIATSRLRFIGQGSIQPIADNGTEAGRRRNRRVEIRVRGKG
ncbi:MAG TPA: OmpA family protein [Cyclobacteriaceae bacterium]|nr:OmpA family protein [Cyclobacteriaceae bacterium]